jgi:hypothetical protein
VKIVSNGKSNGRKKRGKKYFHVPKQKRPRNGMKVKLREKEIPAVLCSQCNLPSFTCHFFFALSTIFLLCFFHHKNIYNFLFRRRRLDYSALEVEEVGEEVSE